MSEAIPPPVYVNLKKVTNMNNGGKKKTTPTSPAMYSPVRKPTSKKNGQNNSATRSSVTKEKELQVEIMTEMGSAKRTDIMKAASIKSSGARGSDRNTIDDLFRNTSTMVNERKFSMREHSLNKMGAPEVQRVKVIVQSRLGQLN